MKIILDNWRPYQFLFDSDAHNFRYCTNKSRNFSHALPTPTRYVEKYSQTRCIMICIKCDIFDGRYVFWNSHLAFLWQPKHKVA